jgi:aminomethyltransferase
MVADSNTHLLTSPLNDRHVELGAKFAQFGGWSMPLEYSGAVTEHRAVRGAVGMFDVSHLGKVIISGPGAAAYVNTCLTNDLAKLGPGQAQYTLCCTEDGGVVDDLIAYLRSDDDVFLIPNAANAGTVADMLSHHAPNGVSIVDAHRDYAVLAVQGPASDETLAAAGYPVGHDYMSFVQFDQDGSEVVVCRTGYTGERGYELVVHTDAAVAVWDAVMNAGASHGLAPAGLAARDTLRTEMGYPLHGQDISPSVTPVEARLGWAVGWRKERFWGDRALREQKERGVGRYLRGLVATGRGIPRPHMTVSDAEQRPLGEVTSGTFSPTRKIGVGLALLDAGVPDGGDVVVDVRGRAQAFTVTKPPFVTPGVKEKP